MLNLISGRFHPGLETAFRDRVLELKKNPLARVAVVAPSNRISDRLQKVLACTQRTFLNIHFHTFTSLAESVVDAKGSLPKPVLSDPLFFDTLVKQIVRDDKPFQAFEELAVPEGFPPAVRGTLRDLLDAGINEENVEQAIQEEFAGQEVDLGSLRSLLQLYRLYLARIQKLPVLPRAEVLKAAIELAPKSPFLKNFDEILYYGFYDLTGLQADFFQSVVKNHPAQFFFPYVSDDPAYAFAKRFRDTFVLPVVKEEERLDVEMKEVSAKILNVSGLQDEAWWIANEIRRLHDEEKISFSDIGVVARTKDRLGFFLQEAFLDRAIPFQTAQKVSLMLFPETMQAIRALDTHVPATMSATWPEWVEQAEKLIADSLSEKREILLEELRRQAAFELIQSKVSWKEFVQTVSERWERTEVDDPLANKAGVSLLYAEAARGLTFSAMFLIGVEEKVFPRIIREDPFLRDDARLALNQTLGHKINQKMTALEEERLLFELLTSGTGQHLYLLYQRSDDDGAVVGASPFLRAFAEQHNLSMEKDVVSVHRPLLEKIKTADPKTLGSTDILIGLLSAKRQAEALSFASEVDGDRHRLESGLRLQKAIHSFKEPGAYDGLVGDAITADVFRNGKISATALESYAQCGFKYFAERLLALKPIEEENLEEKLAADIRGKLVHGFIEQFYRRVTNEGKSLPPTEFPKKIYDEVFDETIPLSAPEDAMLLAMLWQATRDSLHVGLRFFLEREFADRAGGGFQPTFFEVEVEGPLPAPLDKWTWTGKIDRIDVKGSLAQVIDYKTGKPFKGKVVSTLAKKLEKLQAPLYILLAEKFFASMGKNLQVDAFRYDFIDHLDEARLFGAEEWKDHAPAILSAVKILIDAAHQGKFVMKPGWYCDYCSVAQACRKNHGISVYRAAQAVKSQ